MMSSTAVSTPSIRSRPTSRAGRDATVQPGSIKRIPVTTPATSRASGPTVSRLGANGQTPAAGTRPHVVFSPTIPQHAAGIRTDPPVSVPNPISTSPLATATALPLDEPPGMRSGAAGLTGVPNTALSPAGLTHNSVSVVLPTMNAPAARTPARHNASDLAGAARSRT